MNPFKDLYHLLFPDVCLGCHSTLLPDEHTLCLKCRMLLPAIHNVGHLNPAECRLQRQFPFERGAAFCYYQRDELFARLIKEAKYHGHPFVNRDLTRLFLPELDHGAWPGDITCIIPVPIHWRRRLSRGYNQSEPIARALGEHWSIRVETNCLIKSTYARSQVKGSHAERYEMTRRSIFSVRHTERIEGQHILLVDDVHTSGSTLIACARELLRVPGVRISFLTLGLTH